MLCSGEGVGEGIGKMTTQVVTPQRRFRTWQADERRELARHLMNGRSLPAMARTLGRTQSGVRGQITKTMRYDARDEATRAAGMSVRDMTAALGLCATRYIYDWSAKGWFALHTTRIYTGKQYASVDPDAVVAWLESWGALLPLIQPTELAWREIVDEARAALLKRYISRVDLAPLLGLSYRGFIRLTQRRHDFPKPAVEHTASMPDYYDRAAVRAWLDAAPKNAKYWTRAGREQL